MPFVALLHKVVFLVNHAWVVEILVENFRKKLRFNEAEQITSFNMGTREQHSSINIHGRLIEGIWR